MTDANKGGKHFNIIISILLAIVLWLYVVNVENPNTDMRLGNVPVTLQGVTELEAEGLMVTELSRDSMKLKVTGKRKTFLKLNQSQVTVSVDVSKIKEAGEVTLVGRVVSSDASLTNLLNFSESDNYSVTATIQKRDSKVVPVVGELVGTLASGFEVNTIETSLATVEVVGPEDVISQISHAVVNVQGELAKEKITQEAVPILLVDEEGTVIQNTNVSTNMQTCDVTMTVVRVYELPLSVDIVPGGGAQESDAAVTITPGSITVSGNEQTIENLTEISLGNVELVDVYHNKTGRFPIPLPAGVVNRSGERTALVHVTIQNLPMRSVGVSRFEFINVPEGFEATLPNHSLQVWVRGEQSKLDSVNGGQLRAVINLADALPEEGRQRAKANVYLEGAAEVGIVGSDYSVSFMLERS